MEILKEFKDRIKLPFSFDVEKMNAEVQALKKQSYTYYRVISLRAPAHYVDTSLPIPPPALDYADGSWTQWMNTEVLENCPYIKSIVDKFSSLTTVNLVRLLFLAPNSVVKEHTDPTLAIEEEKSMIRLTIPVENNDGVAFYLNDTVVPMRVGECWYLRLSDVHRVVNNGDTDRINLTLDIIPNDTILAILESSMRS